MELLVFPKCHCLYQECDIAVDTVMLKKNVNGQHVKFDICIYHVCQDSKL